MLRLFRLFAVCGRYFWGLDLLGLGLSAGLFRVVRIMRIARVTSIFNGIRVSRFIAFVCVAKDIIAIITLNEYTKEREAPSECQGRWVVCNLSAFFTGTDCTHTGRRKRSHSLRPGARRRQG